MFTSKSFFKQLNEASMFDSGFSGGEVVGDDGTRVIRISHEPSGITVYGSSREEALQNLAKEAERRVADYNNVKGQLTKAEDGYIRQSDRLAASQEEVSALKTAAENEKSKIGHKIGKAITEHPWLAGAGSAGVLTALTGGAYLLGKRRAAALAAKKR